MIRFGAGLGLVVAFGVAMFFAGDWYGSSAREWAKCKAETARRNAEVAKVNKEETERNEIDEEARRIQLEQFAACPGAQQCILTKETVACLDLLSE